MQSHGVRYAGPAAGVLGLVLGLVLTLVLTAVLTACGGTPSADPSGDATVASGSASASASASGTASSGASSPSPTVPVADPSHAVPMPGPRTGDLLSADLLVWSQKSLPDSVLKRIEKVRGVSGVEPISLAQVSIEDRLVKVAAVDPATYRDYTPLQSADSDDVWQRVAGGEVAVDLTRKKRVVPSADGYVTMGSEKGAPAIHLGAYLQQVPGLEDALVVNEKWGAEMGMAPQNALIISTTDTAPDRVVKPVQKVVGKDVSVQRLDIVARAGLDIHATQTAYVVGSVADAVGHYTYRALGGGRIAPDPAWVSAHIVQAQVPIIGTVTCNRLMIPQLRAALQEVEEQGLAGTIHAYNGCYNPRFIAGTSSLSNHAFGLAIDLNASENARGTAGQMNRQVVAIFQKWGFTWGGVWHYTDPMHFEMNRIVHPG
ncbi:M15 family metallopeptidase [Nocardioides sp. KR10-350]|uniref:M15 family metallopeptidase n=1 Tax=Nocardioides cheoyonin TaxID=3156615 RepID=UPI0032B4716D